MRNVKAVWISADNVLSLSYERGESPYTQGFLLFLCQDIGCFTSEIEKNTSEIIFFLGVSGKFLGQVAVIIADVEPPKVKTYLFSQEADLTVRG